MVIHVYHAGYSDTWDADGTSRTCERRVDRYLIVYQKWRNWTQQTAEWGQCCRGLVLLTFKLATTLSLLRRLLCSISSRLIDNQISVHSSLTRSWCSTRVPSVRTPGVYMEWCDCQTRNMFPVFSIIVYLAPTNSYNAPPPGKPYYKQSPITLLKLKHGTPLIFTSNSRDISVTIIIMKQFEYSPQL